MLMCSLSMIISSINPVNGSIIKEYKEDTSKIVHQKIDQVHHSWLSYRTTDFAYRAALLKKIAELINESKEELARIMALEMGKPIKAGLAEVLKCASVCDYYADNGADFLADKLVETAASRVM